MAVFEEEVDDGEAEFGVIMDRDGADEDGDFLSEVPKKGAGGAATGACLPSMNFVGTINPKGFGSETTADAVASVV